MINFRSFSTPAQLLLGVLAATMALPSTSALAVEKCKVKVDGKTGAIRISAANLTGILRWGDSEGQETRTFSNAATCLADGKAKKCALGIQGSPEEIIPPEMCRIFLNDAGPGCSVFIKGCVPGIRPGSLVTGPPGPKGDKGDKGDRGPPGPRGHDDD